MEEISRNKWRSRLVEIRSQIGESKKYSYIFEVTESVLNDLEKTNDTDDIEIGMGIYDSIDLDWKDYLYCSIYQDCIIIRRTSKNNERYMLKSYFSPEEACQIIREMKKV